MNKIVKLFSRQKPHRVALFGVLNVLAPCSYLDSWDEYKDRRSFTFDQNYMILILFFPSIQFPRRWSRTPTAPRTWICWFTKFFGRLECKTLSIQIKLLLYVNISLFEKDADLKVVYVFCSNYFSQGSPLATYHLLRRLLFWVFCQMW